MLRIRTEARSSMTENPAWRFVIASLLEDGDRKSTRLNSSHLVISYAVFCLKKKKDYIRDSLSPASYGLYYMSMANAGCMVSTPCVGPRFKLVSGRHPAAAGGLARVFPAST